MKSMSQISPRSHPEGHHMWPVKLLRLCLLLPSSALAADYYFAANGNDLNACTQAQPCRSIAKINTLINSAMPGDTFYLRGGQVFDADQRDCIRAFDVDGTPGNPITIRSYGGGRAIIQNCRGGHTTIAGKLTDWWVIDNLEFRNSSNAIRCEGCENWIVQNNSFHHMGKACVNIKPFLSTPSARWTFRHNVCYEAGLEGNGEGFYLIGAKDVVIEHNEFFHLRDEGVNCKRFSSNIVVRHNYFHDFYDPEGSVGRLVAQAMTPSEDTAINARVVANTRITAARNWLENMPFEGIRMEYTQHAATQYNVIVGTGGAAIAHKSGAKGQIAYNTIYDNGSAYLNELSFPTTNDNIAWANDGGNDETNPLFAGPVGGDFNLTAISDRINTGISNLSKGVFHSPTLKTCKLNSPNTIRCEVGPIRFSPLRCPKPRALIVRVNGQPRPSAACGVVAGKMIDIAFSGIGVQQNDTIRLSASYGALQDSAWIGGRTPAGSCLAAPSVCNSMLLPVRNRSVLH